jgi:hypothetical protein
MMVATSQGPTMQINPPFGYQKIVPFYRNTKVRLPGTDELPAFVRETNAVPVSYTEFAVACRDYPLVFVTTDGSKSFSPVAIIGIAGNENLFVRDAQWDKSVYLPAYIRRYPFCMARVTLDGQEQADRLVCVEEAFLSDAGETMFDAAGNPLDGRGQAAGGIRARPRADARDVRNPCRLRAPRALYPAGGAGGCAAAQSRRDVPG